MIKKIFFKFKSEKERKRERETNKQSHEFNQQKYLLFKKKNNRKSEYINSSLVVELVI
jgi:hypothetical protein